MPVVLCRSIWTAGTARRCESRINPCNVAVLAGERSGIRRLDCSCDGRARTRDEKKSSRQAAKQGRHNTDHRSARPPVCTRQHHPLKIYFICYHSRASHAKKTAAYDYASSLAIFHTMERRASSPVHRDAGRAGTPGTPPTRPTSSSSRKRRPNQARARFA